MKRNKLIKIFAIMMIAILSLGTLASCGKKEADSKKLKIVVTTFPEYDWVREILGDRVKDVDLKLLQKNGTDLHSFQPSAQDIKDISNADIFVYVGGESDEWVADVLKKKKNKDLVAINLMDEMKDSKKAEEVKEGMQPEKEDEGDGHHHENMYGYLSRMRLSSASLSSRQLLRRMRSMLILTRRTSMPTLRS